MKRDLTTAEIQAILDAQRAQSIIHKKGDGYVRMVQSVRDRVQTPEYKENLKRGRERWWNSLSEQERQRWHEKQSQHSRRVSLSFRDAEQAHEIFWQCWGEDRGEILYKKLAQKYEVGLGGIIALVRGNSDGTTHCLCPVDVATLESMKQEWIDRYQSYTITAISPGRDRLAEYDRLYEASDWYAKVVPAWKMTTPSVVYHCRYKLKNPTPQRVRDYCDSLGIPRIKNDLGQYKMLLERFKWLTKKISKTYKFDSIDAAAEFFTAEFGKPISRSQIFENLQKGLAMRDTTPFAGWILTKTAK